MFCTYSLLVTQTGVRLKRTSRRSPAPLVACSRVRPLVTHSRPPLIPLSAPPKAAAKANKEALKTQKAAQKQREIDSARANSEADAYRRIGKPQPIELQERLAAIRAAEEAQETVDEFGPGSRLAQVVDWCGGKDFDGVLVFDGAQAPADHSLLAPPPRVHSACCPSAQAPPAPYMLCDSG